MQEFTPVPSLIGGLMIGGAAALYLLLAGGIAGISGMLESALQPRGAQFPVAIAFLLGLPLGALVVAMIAPGLVPPVRIGGSTALLVVAGLVTGFGARLGGGCTSGHGVCGIPRLSIRSIIATLTFMATAAVTVFLIRHVI